MSGLFQLLVSLPGHDIAALGMVIVTAADFQNDATKRSLAILDHETPHLGSLPVQAGPFVVLAEGVSTAPVCPVATLAINEVSARGDNLKKAFLDKISTV